MLLAPIHKAKMRPLLILIIFLLASRIHGTRVERGSAMHSKFNKIHSLNEGEHALINAGISRKLLTKPPIVSTKAKSKKEESNTTEGNSETDILDIAGMDYSPAKRKPPIHN